MKKLPPTKRIKLDTPCTECNYSFGLVLYLHENHAGFVRCGSCDSPLYSIADREVGV